MLKILIVLFSLVSFAHAEIGEIVSLKGGSDSVLQRGGQEHRLSEGMLLELGDLIESRDSHVVILLYPSIQMSFVKGTELKLTGHLIKDKKTTSIVGLLKGLVRVLVTRGEGEEVDQKIEAQGVAFAVRGTEYEVSSSDEAAELDVIEGQVEVSSPHVQTFVPEIVKPREGFRYLRQKRQFARKEFRTRIQEARFLKREAMKERWQNKKAKREEMKEKRRENRGDIREKRSSRREQREQRKGRSR